MSHVNFRAEDGVISNGSSKLVEFPIRWCGGQKPILAPAALCVLTHSTAAAKNCRGENSQYAFVTPDGTAIQGRMVTGGRRTKLVRLGMSAELRALDAEAMQRERQMNEKQAALERRCRNLRSTEQALTEIDEKQRAAEREAISSMPPHGHARVNCPPRAGSRRLPERPRAHPPGRESAQQRAERPKNQAAARRG